MKKITLIVSCFVFPLVIAGCQQPPDNPASARRDAAVSAKASLVVEPGSVADCGPSPGTAATVSWRVKGPPGVEVNVLVADPKSSRFKLFSSGGATGSAETGAWVMPGTRFELVNAKTQEAVASYTVTSKPCSQT